MKMFRYVGATSGKEHAHWPDSVYIVESDSGNPVPFSIHDDEAYESMGCTMDEAIQKMNEAMIANDLNTLGSKEVAKWYNTALITIDRLKKEIEILKNAQEVRDA